MLEAQLALQFRGFGAAAEHDGGTTYAAIAISAAEDPALLALMEHAPPAQRRPNILFAAVHYLLLSGVVDPLADYYDTVRPQGSSTPVDGVGAAFRTFCSSHHDVLCDLLATRSTQTNEVGRCSLLMPALCVIAMQHGGAPISLLDLGTSAGLNLAFDRYGYTYTQVEEGQSVKAGDRSSTVQLPCTVRGPLGVLPPLDLPVLADRAGLDRAPIDATSESEARWLLACLWPDNLTRFGRLRDALGLWRSRPERPRLLQGDMVDDLVEAAATVGGTEPLVIFHSWVAAYLPEDRQRALVETVRKVGQTRPVHHLYAELPYETPGLPMPDGPQVRDSQAATALVHIGPDGVPTRWGNVHPHGTWLRWLATPTGPTGHRGERGPAHRPG